MILRSAGFVVLAILIAALFIRIHANVRWEAMLRWRDERIRKAESRDASRPVLRGTALSGNAWDDYSKALRILDNIWSNTDEMNDLLRPEKEPEIEAKEAVVTKAAPALDLFFQATRRSKGQHPIDWEDGYMRWRGLSRWLSSEQYLLLLALWKSQVLEAGGRFREASETLLDMCQFGRDSEFNTTGRRGRCGFTAYAVALSALSDLIVKRRLDPEGLKTVGQELEILDNSFPPFVHTIMNESMWVPTRCIGIDAGDGSFDGRPLHAIWRTGFSIRPLLVDVAESAERVMRPAEETDRQPWMESQATFQAIRNELARSNSPIDPGTWTFGEAKASRGNLAFIRVLRIACSFLATGEFPILADPFGGKMLTSRTGGRLKVWSVGANGIDDGGVGNWKDEEQPLDLVIECER